MRYEKFNFIRVVLTIVTICSIATFVGVFQILSIHNRIIKRGTNTDINLANIVKNLEHTDNECQDQLSILEEQVSTLYEFHKGEAIKPVVKFLDE